MPNYTFQDPTGNRREFIAPMGAIHLTRDGIDWERISEPEGFQIPAPGNDSQKERIRQGYYRHEQEGRWSSQFTKSEIRKAWDL